MKSLSLIFDKLIEKYPLTRALRLDKVLLAGLISTLQMYVTESYIDIPIWNMISKSKEDMLIIVRNWKDKLDNYEFLQNRVWLELEKVQ